MKKFLISFMIKFLNKHGYRSVHKLQWECERISEYNFNKRPEFPYYVGTKLYQMFGEMINDGKQWTNKEIETAIFETEQMNLNKE